QEVKRFGLKVPDDVAVIGFSNTPSSLIVEPALTTIDDHAFEMGYDFKAVGNRSDFELYTQLKDRKLLCIYAAHQMEDVVKEQLISSQKGEIIIDNRQTDLSLKALLMEKIIYILLSISHSGNSEVNYLEDDRDLSPLQEKIDNMEIVRGMDLLQEIHFGEDKVVSGKSYAFKAHGNELYFEQNSTNSQIAAGISEYLFDNLSIAESLELILFHKETQVLILEYDPKEVANINKKWKKDFISKFRKFQREILQDFELLGEDDEKWYIYNTNHKSKLLIALDNLGRLEELSEKIAILKESESYIGYFDGFDLEIDRSDLINRVSALRLLAENVREISEELRSELLAIRPQLGNEDKIHKLEQFVADSMPSLSQEQIEMKQHEVTIQSRLESIFERLSSFAKPSTRLGLKGGKKTEIKAKKKALVFMGNAVGGNSELDLATMGATGEEEVLAYVILQFLELCKQKQFQAIEEIYDVLRKKLSIPALEGYKTACIEAVGKREELARTLIPFLYVTLHAKYAYFDLISYIDNVPTLIEVKTTHNDKNNRFFMSAAEIDVARGGEAYQIVRVSPSAITFLGNPISLVERQLAKITGDNFTITPRNYEVKLHI
ncbi:MAG: DUF3883 domain-containing protein, partial [Spirochaetales bacterium]|nr:DUF3883 domain-containing protein [Spirochaetales bacterium]